MGRVKGYVDLLADSRYVIYSVYMVIHQGKYMVEWPYGF